MHHLEYDLGSIARVLTPFQRWLQDEHPDEVRTMLRAGSGDPAQPRYTDDSVALWTLRAAEYLATLGG